MRPDLRDRRDAFLDRLGTRPLVMGILNVTPDSFFDGGAYLEVDAAVARAERMAAEGCDIVDIGAESTRPGAAPVAESEEMRRLAPVLAALPRMFSTPMSVDTSKAAVAALALSHGAVMVNDVWGLQKDRRMGEVVAEAEAAVILMHNRHERDHAIDIIADIRDFFDRSLAIAARCGIPQKHIVLDVGIGFAKTARQNRDAIARLGELKDYGLPIMVGVSRKGLLGSLTAEGVEQTLAGTLAASCAAIAAGAAMVRVHDVAAHVAALRVFRAIHGASPPLPHAIG